MVNISIQDKPADMQVKGKSNTLLAFSLILFISTLLTYLSRNNSFFWDNMVQLSTPANWYYYNNFSKFFLPDDIATGHQPFVGMYLAMVWKIAGRSIVVSHIALFPFIVGIFWQLYLILKRFFEPKFVLLSFLFVALDPTLLAQLTLITFEIVHIFFFLLAINALLSDKKLLLTIACIGLSLVSLRSVMSLAGVGIFQIYILIQNKDRNLIKPFFSFLLSFICISVFLLAHYLHKDWIVHNTVSQNWQVSSEYASPFEMLRNTFLVGWRLIDFGRVGVYLVLLFIIISSLLKRKFVDVNFKTLFFVALTQLIVFFPVVIIYKNPFGHRYFLPVIIFVTIAVLYWIFYYSKFPKIVYSIVLLVLVSGSFWVYPMKIAMGWDATPAHWPYYSLRQNMIQYLHSKNVKIREVSSFFPNVTNWKILDLKNEDIRFRNADLTTDSLVIYSNVFNVEDEVIDELFYSGNWTKVHEEKSGMVYMILFKKEK